MKRLLAMEMNVLVYDPFKTNEEIQAAGAECVTDLDAALSRADFVSLQCPKSPATIGLIGAETAQADEAHSISDQHRAAVASLMRRRSIPRSLKA